MSRAVSTPLVIGAKGSALDLVMNTIYFGDQVPELITMAASARVDDTELALPIPLYVRFRARGNPVVGTTLDYFDFRGLKIRKGRQLALLGDCVLGATVAEALSLNPGGSLVSSPGTLFDLAGVYPLKMKVVGVLQNLCLRSVGKKGAIFGVQPRNFKGLSRLSVKSSRHTD